MASENSFDAKAADWDARPLVKDLTMAAAEVRAGLIARQNRTGLDGRAGEELAWAWCQPRWCLPLLAPEQPTNHGGHGWLQALKAEVMEPNIDILDYGCGTGLLAQALAGDAALVLGVDSSQGMIERFQQR